MDILPPPTDDAQPPRTFRSQYGSPEEEARERNAARRARVLSHPDIARRLCLPPMRYSSPEMWTGFIPPAEVDSGRGWVANKSPIRKQLMAIVRSVADREAAQAAEEEAS